MKEDTINKENLTLKVTNLEKCSPPEKDLDIFIEICKEMNNFHNLEQLLDFFVNKIAEVFNIRRVSFMGVDQEKEELSIKASYGLNPFAFNSKVKVGEMFSGWVAKQNEYLWVKDIGSEFPDLLRDRVLRYKTKSFLIIPIEGKKGVMGILNLTDKKDDINGFTEQEIKIIDALSLYLALEIDNINLAESNAELVTIDSLTGLFNHRYFQEQLLEEIYHAERYRNRISLLMIDIDDFSLYNQTYGYSAGDSSLKQISRVIKENTRRVDIAARYGPEEFMVILPNTRIKQAVIAAERIRDAVSFSVFSEDRTTSLGMARLTVSIGVVEHKVGLNKDELIRRAVSALLEAKQNGKNCISTD